MNMPNQIMVIAPYWVDDLGAWVFDDPKAGLEQEPFVSGVPEMIDFVVKEGKAEEKKAEGEKEKAEGGRGKGEKDTKTQTVAVWNHNSSTVAV